MRRIYGQDAQTHSAQAVQININLRNAEQQSGAAIEVSHSLAEKSLNNQRG
jgi:hypothetical protein